LRQLYGADLSVNTLGATLERGKAHERDVAIDRLGHAPATDESTARLRSAMTDDYPLLRFFAKAALERRLGRRLDDDPQASTTEIEQQLARAMNDVAATDHDEVDP
jgi:hypothetical protein